MHTSLHTPEDFMRRAIRLSHDNMKRGVGGPFGAVIVKDGEIIGEGWNHVTSDNDPTAHAEVSAIRDACRRLGTFKLEGCDIYTSCEPCPMCLAAIYWAHIDRIFYANTQKDAAAIDFDDAFLYHEVALRRDERRIKSTRLLPEEALKVFKEWQDKKDKTPY
ncbi:MAG TPA: tRNA-specific adenosine deaminase [Rhodospirillaceae bacterium]|nr:MAG: tRNA-specific adenosine deaminase [Alphaproteobacteria bacterium GWF2_58_20]HAU28641.1 tRNA-specific adenosine deaminase [Rhodospirillaceae bacterium]